MSRRHLPLSLLVPLATAVLLAACTAAPESSAHAGNAATAGHDSGRAVPPPQADGFDAGGETDDPDFDPDFDPDNYDPAEHIRKQLLRQAPPAGSGGPAQACMLSGRIELPGVSEDVRDCMQSNGRFSQAEFRRACEGLANALTGSGNAPAKIEYLDKCPTPAQGSCRNFMNTGMDAYYYQRTELASLPGSCSSVGGTWVPAR